MKALIIKQPGEAEVNAIPEPVVSEKNILLKVRMIGLCGSDLNSFRGKNPMVSFPRIPGHEVAATIVTGSAAFPSLAAGVNVTLSPYTSCGKCASCLRQRPNACQFNETLGVQRDGALTEYIAMPAEKLYTANLDLKELCLVEPLTVGFHAARRGRITETDTVAVFGCGGVGLGAIAASHFLRANTIAVDADDAAGDGDRGWSRADSPDGAHLGKIGQYRARLFGSSAGLHLHCVLFLAGVEAAPTCGKVTIRGVC